MKVLSPYIIDFRENTGVVKYEPKTRETDASVEDFLNSVTTPALSLETVAALSVFREYLLSGIFASVRGSRS
jgi:hypothetical protein